MRGDSKCEAHPIRTPDLNYGDFTESSVLGWASQMQLGSSDWGHEHKLAQTYCFSLDANCIALHRVDRFDFKRRHRLGRTYSHYYRRRKS